MKKITKKIFVVFPNNLFYPFPKEFRNSHVFLVEEDLFFKILPFHKHKLVFHRASMKNYFSSLKKDGIEVSYIDAFSSFSDVYQLILSINKNYQIEEIITFDPVDDWLKKKIEKAALFTKSRLTFINNPLFINKKDDLFDYFDKNKRYFQTEFYIRQRRKISLLVDRFGLPVGGSWTYDKENRKRYPENKKPPEIVFLPMDDFYKEAVEYVEKNFPKNVGEINKNFFLPKNHKEASLFFDSFLKERLFEFGPYQDAIVKDSLLINHSLLSPLLNAGIILPKEAIEKTINFYLEKKVPLSSVEGFLRQIVGWREFIRGVYEPTKKIITGQLDNDNSLINIERYSLPFDIYRYDISGIVALDNNRIAVCSSAPAYNNQRFEGIQVLVDFYEINNNRLNLNGSIPIGDITSAEGLGGISGVKMNIVKISDQQLILVSTPHNGVYIVSSDPNSNFQYPINGAGLGGHKRYLPTLRRTG